MSKIKLNHVIACAFIVAFLLSSASARAQVDGMAGIDTVEDKAVVLGTVTKDITDKLNIFTGSYGDGLTYTLDGLALRSGEIYDSSSDDSTNGYGNITFDPAAIQCDWYNSSGLLNADKWTETDADAVLTWTEGVTVGDEPDAPSASRITVDYGSGKDIGSVSLTYTFDVARTEDKYFMLGFKVITETLNVTAAELTLSLYDSSDNILSFRLYENPTAYGISSSGQTEWITLDGDDGDVILFQAKLSDWDSWESAMDFGSVIKIIISFPVQPCEGKIVLDFFALEFLDTVAKAGYSRQNQLTVENDYVALNISDADVQNIKVRELDSHITRINDAEIDFVYLPEVEEIYSFDEEQETYSVTYDYQIQIDTEDDWADEVSFSNMELYYVLGADDSVYTSFIYAGSEKSSLLLNEEAGDAILLDNIVEDTIYLLQVEKALSQTEYDLAVGNASGNIFDELYLALIALGIAILGFIPSVKHRLENKKREKLTEIKNRK